MDKVSLAVQAIKNGMEVKAAAQKYGLSETVLNNAIQRELLPNPLGFEGDTYKPSSNQKSETHTEISFWEKAKNKAKAIIKNITPGSNKNLKAKYNYECEQTNTFYVDVDVNNLSDEAKEYFRIKGLEISYLPIEAQMEILEKYKKK